MWKMNSPFILNGSMFKHAEGPRKRAPIFACLGMVLFGVGDQTTRKCWYANYSAAGPQGPPR